MKKGGEFPDVHFSLPLITPCSNAGTAGAEFLASQCNSYEEWGAGICCSSEQEKSVMGEWLEPFFPSFSSQFFLSVGEEAPFAHGEEGLPC